MARSGVLFSGGNWVMLLKRRRWENDNLRNRIPVLVKVSLALQLTNFCTLPETFTRYDTSKSRQQNLGLPDKSVVPLRVLLLTCRETQQENMTHPTISRKRTKTEKKSLLLA